jgi:bifunctional DNA-binding transcriptional regulator/antitoxin component of YhaV-PrlF toxin-antitoxin module
MPQLTRGGKYVFGWSKVGNTGRIVIPREAMEDYKLHDWDRVILMSGSRRSGGFGMTRPSLLRRSPLSPVLSRVPGLANFQMPEGKAVRIEGRAFCWTTIQKGGYITLPAETLRGYEIVEGDRLLSVRGSHLALGFARKGLLVEEALEHPDLEVFE